MVPRRGLSPRGVAEIILRTVARRAESLQVRFFASDRNGSEAEAEVQVEVRRPAVEITVAGPDAITLGDEAPVRDPCGEHGRRCRGAGKRGVLGRRRPAIDRRGTASPVCRESGTTGLGHRPLGRRRNQGLAISSPPADCGRATDPGGRRKRGGRVRREFACGRPRKRSRSATGPSTSEPPACNGNGLNKPSGPLLLWMP